MASSGHTSSLLRHPKQASSLVTSSEPSSFNLKQKMGGTRASPSHQVKLLRHLYAVFPFGDKGGNPLRLPYPF